MKRSTLTLGVTLAVTVALSISIDPGLPLTAAPQPSEHTADRWSNLPARIRRQIHLTTAELPPFPVRPDSLRDIRRWPATWTLEGRSYRLRISAMDWDAMYEVPDRTKIEPGHSYGASYRLDAAEPHSRRLAGPSYWWLPDGTLVEQGYRTSALTQIWAYDAKGVLQQYIRYGSGHERWFSCGKAQPASIKEWFDETGQLLGFQAMGIRYWEGRERTDDEYSRLWQEWREKRPLWRRKPAA
jgi:hypothetical protein